MTFVVETKGENALGFLENTNKNDIGSRKKGEKCFRKFGKYE